MQQAQLQRDTLDEKSAFENFVRLKASLTSHTFISRGRRLAVEQELRPQRSSVLRPQPQQSMRIVVDERELRAALPLELYEAGVSIVLRTLVTGDYVLSPHIAVERKATKDLVQSLAMGRLGNQLLNMSRVFNRVFLLVESDRAQPFSLFLPPRRSGGRGGDDEGMECVVTKKTQILIQKLVKLAITVRKVSFLWARSPSHAAALLVRLKSTIATEDPDPSDPALTNSRIENSKAESRAAMELLLRLPGVTSRNFAGLAEACGTVAGLAMLSKERIAAALGDKTAGEKLHSFLHSPFPTRTALNAADDDPAEDLGNAATNAAPIVVS